MKQLSLQQFANSKKTKREIRKRMKLAEKSIEAYKKARQIEDWILNKPMTI